jgi:hypothetical protein
LLHFYKKDDKWVYVAEKDYQSQKDSLPDVCFAARCPIDQLESKEWPKLDEIANQLESEGKFKQKCQVEDKEIENVMYYSRY